MIKKKYYRLVKNHIGIGFGAILLAISYSWFLIPYKIAPGGMGGLAQIFFHFFQIPTGVSMLILNIPMFILGIIFLGKIFGLRSFYGMFISALFTDLLSIPNLNKLGFISDYAFKNAYSFNVDGQVIHAILSPDDIYLSAIAGSVIMGLGLGIIFRGSTGGTDIPVAILKQKTGISLGTGYWIVETLIILTTGIVFQDLKLIIWGYINLFIASKITDISSEGLPYTKGFYIISKHYQDIRAEIYKQLARGVTLLNAEGGYTGDEQKIIFCVVSRRQISVIRDLVKDIDPEAFVVMSDVHDVMGYGFKSRSINLADNSEEN